MDSLSTAVRGIAIGRRGKFDAPCPECGPRCRSAANRTRKVLAVWRKDDGFVTYHCARCGAAGYVLPDKTSSAKATSLSQVNSKATKLHAAVSAAEDRAERQANKAAWLWSRRQPAKGTVVEEYLHSRGYSGHIPASIGYLPPSKDEHHPAMIAAFGGMVRQQNVLTSLEPEPDVLAIDDDAVTGVHLTLLKPDGSSKAATEREKLMVGPSNGWPIVLAPLNDSLGMCVVEGIETGLSLMTTGLGIWAAGAAGRMPGLAAKVLADVDCVTVVGEADDAGQKGARELAKRLRERGIYVEERAV